MTKFQDELKEELLAVIKANQQAFKSGAYIDGAIEAESWVKLESLISRLLHTGEDN